MRGFGIGVRTAGFRRRGTLVLALCAATLLVAPGAAHAQSSGGSAIDQYVEDVPTGAGKSHPGKGTPTRTTLPQQVTQQIARQGGSDTPLLQEIASSSTYGAPQTDPAKKKKKDRSPGGDEGETEVAAATSDDGDASGALSAAVNTVQGSETSRLLGLFGALLAISLVALAAAFLRHRRRAIQ